MLNIEIIIGYIIGGTGTLLALLNFIYTWWKTRVRGPDFRINQIWGIATNPTKAGKQTQCYFSLYYERWNYGDRPAIFHYEIKVEVLVGDKPFSNTTYEEITLEPQRGEKKQLGLNLPEGSINWSKGIVTFTCDYFNHKGKPRTYQESFSFVCPD